MYERTVIETSATVGAIVFFTAVVLYIWMVGLDRHWSWYVSISVPAFIVSILFFLNWFSLIVATVAFLVFEIYAVQLFKTGDAFWFVANQLEALIFLAAIYYSTKTLRAKYTK